MKAFLLIFLIMIPFSAAQLEYVNDYSGIFSAEEKQALEAELSAFAAQTNGVQIVVYVEDKIPSGMTLEERSLKLAEQYKLGNEEADNGVLFYLAVEDKKFRWEVGYGVEDVLNTPFIGRLSRQTMVPYFQKGEYATGIINGITVAKDALILANDSDVIAQEPKKNTIPLWLIILILIAIVFFIILLANMSGKKGFRNYNDKVYIGALSGLFGKGSGGFGGGGSFGGGGFSGNF